MATVAKDTALGKRRTDARVNAWAADQFEPFRTVMDQIDTLERTTKKLKQENAKLKEAFDLVYKTLLHNQKQHKSLRDQVLTHSAYHLQVHCVHAAVFGEMQNHARDFEARIVRLEARTPEQAMQNDINKSQQRRIEALEAAAQIHEM